VRGGGAALAGLLLAGCAGPSLLLLPDEEGGQGAVAVLDQKTGGTRGEVRDGNTRSRLSRDRLAARRIDPSRIKKGERDALGNLPPRPKAFRVRFGLDSAALAPSEQLIIDAVSQEVRQRPGVEVEIIGHTDTTGDADYNRTLSVDRAEMIVQALLQRAVPADVITLVAGEGEESLAVATADEVADPRNRRVDITVR
jgi:outer membrane protein OmpA-like peptidoglycan-associated protein